MSLAMRAVLAVVLFVGFYVMAVAIAGLLLMLPVLEVLILERIHFQLVIGCLVAAGVILWSVMPRFDRFVAPELETAAELVRSGAVLAAARVAGEIT